MPKPKRPQTLGALRKSKYEVISVRNELRKNLIAKIRSEEAVFPGIVGFDDTVIPQLENAILAGQDIILLGERGQAKSRIIRSMTNLLDDAIPKIAECESNDNPYEPICKSCVDKVSDLGEKTPLEWITREERYSEKLATPDISIADLIGEIDPIKVAEGHYLSDELAIHYGLVPRTNRGIFCINALPDLAERIQVGLFNLMEERDVQIKGYRVRLPLDVLVVSTANPEDYTNRGRIVTPLKDRYGSQIHTHYPLDPKDEISIIDQERAKFPEEDKLVIPEYMKETLVEITTQARLSSEINQRSGVSEVRGRLANYSGRSTPRTSSTSRTMSVSSAMKASFCFFRISSACLSASFAREASRSFSSSCSRCASDSLRAASSSLDLMTSATASAVAFACASSISFFLALISARWTSAAEGLAAFPQGWRRIRNGDRRVTGVCAASGERERATYPLAADAAERRRR